MLPVAFLTWTALGPAGVDRTARRVAVLGLAASAALHGLTGSAVLGAHGSDLAEAWGAFLLGGVALFGAVGWLLRARPAQ
jgi:outer membrane lipoprotein SlyB